MVEYIRRPRRHLGQFDLPVDLLVDAFVRVVIRVTKRPPDEITFFYDGFINGLLTHRQVIIFRKLLLWVSLLEFELKIALADGYLLVVIQDAPSPPVFNASLPVFGAVGEVSKVHKFSLLWLCHSHVDVIWAFWIVY